MTKKRALKVSLIAISSVILIEGFGGFLTGSLALVSDAAHAGFDALSTLMLLVATSLSLRPADEDHTYGHGKIETLGALFGGILLLVLAAIILIEAAFRLTAGSQVHPSLIGYGSVGYTLAMDFVRMGILSSASKTGSLTIKAGLYDAISDFASTVMALLALGLASLGYPVGDTIVSIILASLLVILSARLIHSSSLELSDAVSGKLVQSILREIHKTDEVLKTKELRVRRVGEVTYVDAVIALSPFVELIHADTIAARVEDNLRKLLGKSTIMIHMEPLEWEIPVERQIRNATSMVAGAQGLHNLSVATIDGDLYVTLHLQVDPALDLNEAHKIAEAVERGIETAVPKVRQVTVHLEPSMPESTSASMVDDKYMSETIRSIVRMYPAVSETSSITTYSSEAKLHINLACRFRGEVPISEVHDMVTIIQDRIRRKFPNAIVTIRAEPVVERNKIERETS